MSVFSSEEFSDRLTSSYQSALFIMEELYRSGVRNVFMGSGSRSTPLVLAVVRDSRFSVYTHFDERGLGFYAYGNAIDGGMNAIITTSGTAVANLLPAVVEAYYSHIPLVILSADRPPEEHAVGANQTINQSDLFSSYVVESMSMAFPDYSYPINALLMKLSWVLMRAKVTQRPVHINCSFREPFMASTSQDRFLKSDLKEERLKTWSLSKNNYTVNFSSKNQIDMPALGMLLSKVKRGIIFLGKCQFDSCPFVKSLTDYLDWPLFVDIGSPIRFRLKGMVSPSTILSTLFLQRLDIDGVLILGYRFISKEFKTFFSNLNCPIVHVTDVNVLDDPYWRYTHRFYGGFDSDLRHYFKNVEMDVMWKRTFQTYLDKVKDVVKRQLDDRQVFSELTIMYILQYYLHRIKFEKIFLGNSLIVRLADYLWMYISKQSVINVVWSNRGASGIDGNIASFLGLASRSLGPVMAILGDLSFMHDLNSLYLLSNLQVSVCMIVLNNKGGGIFRNLSISEDESLERYFCLHHEQDFEQIAKAFRLVYHQVSTLEGLKKSLESYEKNYKKTHSIKPWLIECHVDLSKEEEALLAIKNILSFIS